MISDTLFEAICDLDRYLNDPVFANVYQDDLRAWIISVRNQMDALRGHLDCPPELARRIAERIKGRVQ